MRILRYFVWIIFPLAAYLAYLTFGLPHFRWSYTWLDQGQGYDPFADRYYTRCTYLGPYGEFTLHHPDNGECRWITFMKDQREQS